MTKKPTKSTPEPDYKKDHPDKWNQISAPLIREPKTTITPKTPTCINCTFNEPLPKKPSTFIPNADSICIANPPQLIHVGSKILMMYNRTKTTFPICNLFKCK